MLLFKDVIIFSLASPSYYHFLLSFLSPFFDVFISVIIYLIIFTLFYIVEKVTTKGSPVSKRQETVNVHIDGLLQNIPISVRGPLHPQIYSLPKLSINKAHLTEKTSHLS